MYNLAIKTRISNKIKEEKILKDFKKIKTKFNKEEKIMNFFKKVKIKFNKED